MLRFGVALNMTSINLLRFSRQQQQLRLRQLLYYLLLVALVVCLTIGTWRGFIELQLVQVRKNQQAIEQEVAKLATKYEQALGESKLLTKMEVAAQLSSKCNAIAANELAVLNVLSKTMPKDISLASIHYTNAVIRITGNAASMAAITIFMQHLTSCKLFSNVFLEQINTTEVGNSFELKLTTYAN